MKFIFHSLRSSSSQNLPYGCASDFEINRRGDHRSPVLQTRNFFRRIVGQGLAPAESILINYNLKSGLNVVLKPLLALSVFCEWAVHTYSSTHKKRNLSHFLEVSQRVEIYNWTFSTRWGEHCSPLFLYPKGYKSVTNIKIRYRGNLYLTIPLHPYIM
mgnify:CR=1 FL=1